MPDSFTSEVISEEEKELMQNPEIMDMLIWCVIDFFTKRLSILLTQSSISVG